jgi:hypothetical protein
MLGRLACDLVVPCASEHHIGERCTRRFHRIHSRFDAIIAVLVSLNMAVMAMYYNGMSDQFRNALDLANYVFLAIFALEMLVKHVALGVRGYWRRGSNAFDGCIVVGSVALLVMADAFPSLSAAKQVGDPGLSFLMRVVVGWESLL